MKPEGIERTEFRQKTAISLHRCAVIRLVFSDTMSDFAKFVTQKELIYVLNLIIHMPSLHSNAGLCMVGLVDF
jgi:hypothetical protein